MKTQPTAKQSRTEGAGTHTPTPWNGKDPMDRDPGQLKAQTKFGIPEHSPLPWEVCRFQDNMDEFGIHSPNHPEATKTGKPEPHHMAHAKTVCRGMTGPQKDANAAFIVRAVNAHEELLAALHEARYLLIGHGRRSDMIDKAIAKAEGQ